MGGGVGKAVSELIINDSKNQHLLLLIEEPIDKKYINNIKNSKIIINDNPKDFKKYLNEVDIVQLEWWNHPRLIKYLNEIDEISKPIVTWSHISINEFFDLPDILKNNSDKIILTSYSDFLKNSSSIENKKLQFISSASGYKSNILKKNKSKYSYFYAGTLDYAKMHPDYIKMINLINIKNINFNIKIYGNYNEKFSNEIRNNKNIRKLG